MQSFSTDLTRSKWNRSSYLVRKALYKVCYSSVRKWIVGTSLHKIRKKRIPKFSGFFQIYLVFLLFQMYFAEDCLKKLILLIIGPGLLRCLKNSMFSNFSQPKFLTQEFNTLWSKPIVKTSKCNNFLETPIQKFLLAKREWDEKAFTFD